MSLMPMPMLVLAASHAVGTSQADRFLPACPPPCLPPFLLSFFSPSLTDAQCRSDGAVKVAAAVRLVGVTASRYKRQVATDALVLDIIPEEKV